MYEEISRDYQHACGANGVPGFSNTVWKYRCESRDMARGRSGGFRVLVYVRENNKTLYPFHVYRKSDYEKPPDKDVKAWLKGLLEAL
jgi:hypothetical protein